MNKTFTLQNVDLGCRLDEKIGLSIEYMEEWGFDPSISIDGRTDNDRDGIEQIFIFLNKAYSLDEDVLIETISHELEHVYLYRILMREFQDKKVANTGSFFVSEMSIVDMFALSDEWGTIIAWKKLFVRKLPSDEIKELLEAARKICYPDLRF